MTAVPWDHLDAPCQCEACRALPSLRRKMLRIEAVLWFALAADWFGPWAKSHLLPLLGG